MRVAPNAISLPTDHETALAVGLQSDESIDNVDAGFLHLFGPVDIGGFVEARFELNEGRDLFIGLCSVDQRFDDRRITTCPVEGDLDREH